MPVRGGLCSRVIVGGRECGEPSGSCRYQGPPLRPVVILDHVGNVPARQCIACGAQVAPGQSEACPHD